MVVAMVRRPDRLRNKLPEKMQGRRDGTPRSVSAASTLFDRARRLRWPSVSGHHTWECAQLASAMQSIFAPFWLPGQQIGVCGGGVCATRRRNAIHFRAVLAARAADRGVRGGVCATRRRNAIHFRAVLVARAADQIGVCGGWVRTIRRRNAIHLALRNGAPGTGSIRRESSRAVRASQGPPQPSTVHDAAASQSALSLSPAPFRGYNAPRDKREGPVCRHPAVRNPLFLPRGPSYGG